MPGKKGKEMLLLAASNGSDAGVYFVPSEYHIRTEGRDDSVEMVLDFSLAVSHKSGRVRGVRNSSDTVPFWQRGTHERSEKCHR
jgi:hypothetical protein